MMTIRQKLLVLATLFLILAVSGPGRPGVDPAEAPKILRTVPIQWGVDALGISWTGSISVDEAGAIRLSPEPGLQWDEPPPPDAGAAGFVIGVRRCLSIVRSLLEASAPLAKAVVASGR